MKMFKKPFSFSGRITRLEYFTSLAIYLGIDLICHYVNLKTSSHGLSILLIPCFFFFIAQGAKRSHDIGKSGWWQLFIPYILWLFVAKGDEKDNEYGKTPESLSKWQTLTIGILASIPLAVIIWMMASIHNQKQVTDEYAINKDLLKDNEMTDGIAVFEIPQNIISEKIVIDSASNAIDLFDSKENPSFWLRILSLDNSVYEHDSTEFEAIWKNVYNAAIGNDVTYDIIKEYSNNDVEGKCQRVVMTHTEDSIIFNLVFVYDNKIHRKSMLFGWYSNGDSIPFDIVLRSIRFKQ